MTSPSRRSIGHVAIALIAAASLPSIHPGCSIYDAKLLSEALGDGDGDAPSGGSNGDGDSGGTASMGGDSSGGNGSGASGSGASGSGASGSGGDGMGGDGPASGYELIDDMEDNNQFVAFTSGRNGPWGVYNDESGGSQMPSPGFTTMMDVSGDAPHSGSDYAAYTSGNGFSVWGAVLSATMKSVGSYDANAYSGLRFFAKAGAGANKSMQIRLVTTDTDPRGGVCSEEPTPADEHCYDHFLTQLSLSEDWQRYEVYFDDFVQVNGGKQFPAPALGGLYTIEFLAPANLPFEFWIDDLEFIRLQPP